MKPTPTQSEELEAVRAVMRDERAYRVDDDDLRVVQGELRFLAGRLA